jgi:UDP-glucose 4-epimerase
MESAVGQEFNLASGKETQILDLARMINELTGNKAGICFARRRKWDTKSRRLASIDKARSLIGYNAKTNFQLGLSQAVQWFQENWEHINVAAKFEPGVSSAVRDFPVPEPAIIETAPPLKIGAVR